MATNSERFLRKRQVRDLTGLAVSTIWAWSRDGRLPHGIKLSERVTVWKESEVLAWMKARGESK